jgi:hypothetical protein
MICAASILVAAASCAAWKPSQQISNTWAANDLEKVQPPPGTTTIRFEWGGGWDAGRVELQYDQSLMILIAQTRGTGGPQNIEATVRPSCRESLEKQIADLGLWEAENLVPPGRLNDATRADAPAHRLEARMGNRHRAFSLGPKPDSGQIWEPVDYFVERLRVMATTGRCTDYWEARFTD